MLTVTFNCRLESGHTNIAQGRKKSIKKKNNTFLAYLGFICLCRTCCQIHSFASRLLWRLLKNKIRISGNPLTKAGELLHGTILFFAYSKNGYESSKAKDLRQNMLSSVATLSGLQMIAPFSSYYGLISITASHLQEMDMLLIS